MARPNGIKILKDTFTIRVLSYIVGSVLIIASPILIYGSSPFSSFPVVPSTLWFAFLYAIGIICTSWPLIFETRSQLSVNAFKSFLRYRGISFLSLFASVAFLQSWLIFSVMVGGVGSILYENEASSAYLAGLVGSFMFLFLAEIKTMNKNSRFLFLSFVALVLSAAISFLLSSAITQSIGSSSHSNFLFTDPWLAFIFSLGLVSGFASCLFFILQPKKLERVSNGNEQEMTCSYYSLYNFMFLIAVINLFGIFFFDIIFPLRYNSINSNTKVLVFLPGDQFQNSILILGFIGNAALATLGAMKSLTKLGANIMEGVFGFILVLAGARALSISIPNLVGNISVTSSALFGAEQLVSLVLGSILIANSLADNSPILAMTLSLKLYTRGDSNGNHRNEKEEERKDEELPLDQSSLD
jgi:hypothetical protein